MAEKKLVLITGGARSGKSSFAVQLASGLGERVLYIATAEVGDPEMEARIIRHRNNRPSNWRTIEVTEGPETALKEAGESEVILVDCLTLLVSNLMLNEIRGDIGQGLGDRGQESLRLHSGQAGVRSRESKAVSYESLVESNEAWDKPDEMEKIEGRIVKIVEETLKAAKEIKSTVIIVTNELGLGIVPPYPMGRFYRDLMGIVNQQVATAADEVYFMVSGVPMKIK